MKPEAVGVVNLTETSWMKIKIKHKWIPALYCKRISLKRPDTVCTQVHKSDFLSVLPLDSLTASANQVFESYFLWEHESQKAWISQVCPLFLLATLCSLLTLKQSNQSKKHDSVSNMPVVDRSTASEAVKPNMGSMTDRREKHESKNSYP